jgi:hypothetical protein
VNRTSPRLAIQPFLDPHRTPLLQRLQLREPTPAPAPAYGSRAVEAKIEGASAKELNRTLLSALRKANKRTALRAEWTSGDTAERYFDYVLKKTVKG